MSGFKNKRTYKYYGDNSKHMIDRPCLNVSSPAWQLLGLPQLRLVVVLAQQIFHYRASVRVTWGRGCTYGIWSVSAASFKYPNSSSCPQYSPQICGERHCPLSVFSILSIEQVVRWPPPPSPPLCSATSLNSHHLTLNYNNFLIL